MAKSINSINATVLLTVAGVIGPIALTGWSADDIYDVEDVERAETKIGLDRVLSSGQMPYKVMQTFTFMASSPSIPAMLAWNAANTANGDDFYATMILSLPSVGLKYNQSGGVLTKFPPIIGAKKTLGEQKFQITWEQVLAVPI